jgi:hypothetical protein
MRSKLFGMAFMVILALTSITVATASAETLPNILPLGTAANPVTWDTSILNASFGGEGLTEVTSASSLGESESSGAEGNEGSVHESYFGTKNVLLGICTGTGDNVGVILVTGTYRIRDADLASKLIVALLFFINQFQVLCGTTEMTVAGCVAGNLTPLNVLTKLLLAARNRIGKDNEITSYLSSTGLPEFCFLVAKTGAGATELFAVNQLVDLFNFRQGGIAIEVLVMPL